MHYYIYLYIYRIRSYIKNLLSLNKRIFFFNSISILFSIIILNRNNNKFTLLYFLFLLSFLYNFFYFFRVFELNCTDRLIFSYMSNFLNCTTIKYYNSFTKKKKNRKEIVIKQESQKIHDNI